MFGFDFSGVTDSMMENFTGWVGNSPRIYNVDKDTYSLGQTKYNPLATTSFARTKVHKGRFTGTADIVHGDVILDRHENNYFLVVSISSEMLGGPNVFRDATLYWANRTATMWRKGDAGTLDAYRRPIDPSFEQLNIGSTIYIMVNPLTLDIQEQEDRAINNSKIRVAAQAKFGITKNDRLIISSGETYIVETVDNSSFEGISLCNVDLDTR